MKPRKQHTVNPSVTILVSLSDHLVDLVVGELLADAGHDVSKLSGGDEAVVVAVEDLESLADLLLGVGVLHLARHHGEELGKVNGAVVVGIDLVDHVLQLRLGGVLAERAHHSAELLSGDLSWRSCVSRRYRGWSQCVSYHRRPCPVSKSQPRALPTANMGTRQSLTKRENASLNSETCSSVNESACQHD
jgi:hypothetical protein